MIAVPFLEYIKSERHGVDTIGFSVSQRAIKAIDFYSQEFKPEMIVEFFEEWEPLKDNFGKEIKFCFVLPGITSIFTGSERSIGYSISKHDYPHRPETLDQFITDCQRANIELHFKEEIVNKYFR